jgi:hypothetical protein
LQQEYYSRCELFRKWGAGLRRGRRQKGHASYAVIEAALHNRASRPIQFLKVNRRIRVSETRMPT